MLKIPRLQFCMVKVDSQFLGVLSTHCERESSGDGDTCPLFEVLFQRHSYVLQLP